MPLGSLNSATAQSRLKVFADDTIAGWSTQLRTSVGEAQVPVMFEVYTPDQRVLKLDGISNHEGRTEIEFLGFHTKKAGTYKARAYQAGSYPESDFSYFTVYPDRPHANSSDVILNDHAVSANGSDSTTLTVVLRDEHKNPIANHLIEIFSSRVEDTITLTDQFTDEHGRLTASISSRQEGISTFIVQDKTVDLVLHKRPQISFLPAGGDTNPALGGNSLLMAELLAQDTIEEESSPSASEEIPVTESEPPASNEASVISDSNLHGAVDHFEITLAPSAGSRGTQAKMNEPISVKVQAQDIQDRAVTSYTGTIRFSSTDSNALLPEDYTFKADDLGEKIFSLAVTFAETGSQKIEVIDLDDWDINGSLEIGVVEELETTVSGQEHAIEIKYPENGTTLGQTNVAVSGQGPPNIGIDIYVNGNFQKSADIDTDGFFSVSTKLTDGENKIFIIEKSGKERKSNSVTVQVDNTAPKLDTFEVIPEGDLKTDDFYTVRLTSEPKLDVSIRVIVKHSLVESSSQPGTYEATLPAPAAAGEYPITVILQDQLGNTTEEKPNRTLRVVESAESPPKVTGLRANAGNQKVTLTWDDIRDESEVVVAQYKIYFGENENVLNQTLFTTDATPQVTISNLQNGVTYYFALTAVSEDNVESAEKSLLASATPGANEAQLRGLPGNGYMTLEWDAFEGLPVAGYKAYYGLQTGSYSSFTLVPVTHQSVVIPDLVNNLTYYAVITPVDAAGNELNVRTNEVAVIPSPTAVGVTRGVAPTRPNVIIDHTQPPQGGSGPNTIWIVIISFLITQVVVIGSRRLYRGHR